MTHLRSKTLSVYLVEPMVYLFMVDRFRGASFGPRYLLVYIHELHYFARGRKEVGGANLPILVYLVMEKSEGQTNTLCGGVFVNWCNRNDKVMWNVEIFIHA